MSLFKYTLLGVMIIAAVVVFVACTDKTSDNPTAYYPSQEGLMWEYPLSSWGIFFSLCKDFGYLPMELYSPPGYDYTTQGRPYPTLYLLTPFRGDELYYFHHGLKEVADRLISEGLIEPMFIVCVNGDSHLGGSFYTNSALQGQYFTAITKDTTYSEYYAETGTSTTGIAQSLINSFEQYYPTLLEKENRAIGGVGMGGYGAFKISLMTDYFGSVSAVNAPLDFDGSGSGGFLALFNEAYTASSLDDVDTSLYDPDMSLILSAAAAFSPHYTAFNIDSVYNDAYDRVTFAYTVTDSLTDDISTYVPSVEVHVPFDASGTTVPEIWDLWMDNNIQNIYEGPDAINPAAFDDMPKFLYWSNDARYHYSEQMQTFVQFLDDNSITYEAKEFSGTADYYIYHLLEDILIFHSQNFDIPEELVGKP